MQNRIATSAAAERPALRIKRTEVVDLQRGERERRNEKEKKRGAKETADRNRGYTRRDCSDFAGATHCARAPARAQQKHVATLHNTVVVILDWHLTRARARARSCVHRGENRVARALQRQDKPREAVVFFFYFATSGVVVFCRFLWTLMISRRLQKKSPRDILVSPIRVARCEYIESRFLIYLWNSENDEVSRDSRNNAARTKAALPVEVFHTTFLAFRREDSFVRGGARACVTSAITTVISASLISGNNLSGTQSSHVIREVRRFTQP